MKKTFILCLTLFSFLFSQSQIRYLKGNLQGSQETPPNAETGSGVVIVKYDMATKILNLYGNYTGLSAPVSASHIHFGKPGLPGPVVIPLINSGNTTGTLAVTDTLTQPQEDSLLEGNMYANVHTTNHPQGEIRAQLTLTTEGQTTLLSGKLQGAQEVPPTPSTATGSVYTLVDMGTDSVFVTGSYMGLTGASTASHVHAANPGAPGDIMFDLTHSASADGTVHTATKVTAQQASLILSNGTYANVHTSKYPGGEIRAQLVNNTSVRYLAGDLSGANEVPANTSAARGTVIVVYNSETNLLQLAGDYQKLSDTIMRANLYNAVTGDSVLSLTASKDSTGTLSAIATVSDELETALLAGNIYVNVLTPAISTGEIRTTLVPTTEGDTHAFAVNLTEQQAGHTSTAAGNALVIVDKATGMAYATGAFKGINSNVIEAHIHGGPVGDTGSVILPLFIAQRSPKPHTGTFSGSGVLRPSAVDSMLKGLTYVDVHSQFYSKIPAIRAQLGDLVLPVKFTSLTAYKQKNNIELSWETLEELNVKSYEVEQLNTITQQWISKGTVFAKGGSSAVTYTYTDIPSDYNNKYLIYRIRINDNDGRTTYSYIVKVNFEKLNAELFIQTNPVVNGQLRYTVTGLSSSKKAEVSIIDYNGRLLLKNTSSSFRNNTLNISRLSAGMYKLVVRIDDTILQSSFIK